MKRALLPYEGKAGAFVTAGGHELILVGESAEIINGVMKAMGLGDYETRIRDVVVTSVPQPADEAARKDG